MSQLDSGTFKQVKDLVLSGYHLNDIHGLACSNSLTMMFNQLLSRARQGAAQ